MLICYKKGDSSLPFFAFYPTKNTLKYNTYIIGGANVSTRTIKTEVSDSLEDIFDLAPCTTIKEVAVHEPADIAVPGDYDEKDQEIDKQFQEIYDKALCAFDFQMEQADATDIDPKYAGRTHEVAATFLNLALNAAKEKASLKGMKDKNATSLKKGANTTTNNTMILSHSSLLDMLIEGNDNKENQESEDIIEGEFGEE